MTDLAERIKGIAVWWLLGLAMWFGIVLVARLAMYVFLPDMPIAEIVLILASCAGAGFAFGWLSKSDSVMRGFGGCALLVVAMFIAGGTIAAPVASIPGLPPLPIAVAIGVVLVSSIFLLAAALGEQSVAATARGADAWDECAAWLGTHGPLPLLGFLTIAVLLIHAGVFRGETAGDDLSFHFAESARISDCLRELDFDCWNPSANAGYASAYYYQVIPQLASALPAALFGHHLFWFQLSVVFPLVLAPAAAYRGMRLLGATPWQALVAAFCVAFMNGESRWGSGNAGTFQVGLYTQTWALSAFPLALGHAVRWMTDGNRLASAIGWGAFVFLCHPFAGVCLALALLIGWLAKAVLIGFDHVFRTVALAWPGRPDTIAHWERPPERPMLGELVRGSVLAVVWVLTWLPVLLPIFVVDKEGFGGFPHRVNDEVGPGFAQLWTWYHRGFLLDFAGFFRVAVLTWSLPLIAVFARGSFYRWLWGPALVFALLLGFGPHMGQLGDDIFPPVRALGAMQTVLAMGIGAGAVFLGRQVWNVKAAPSVTLRALAQIGYAAVVVIATLVYLAIVVFTLVLLLGGEDSFAAKLMQATTLHVFGSVAVLRMIGLVPLALATAALVPLWRRSGVTRTPEAEPLARDFQGSPAPAPPAEPRTETSPIVRSALVVITFGVLVGLTLVLWLGDETTFALETVRRLTLRHVASPLLLRILGTLPLALAVVFVLPLWRALASEYGARTGLAAIFAGLVMLVAAPGYTALAGRVRVLGDLPQNNRGEMVQIAEFLAQQPQGRKQTGPGAENHWWNLLTYAWYRVPSLLQMGGGGLQASPNYDFLWTSRDLVKNAWLFDAPYLVFNKAQGEKMPAGEMLLETEHYEVRKLVAPGLVTPVHVTGVLPPGDRARPLEPGHKAALDWIKGDKPLKDEVMCYAGFGQVGDPPDAKTVRSWHQDSPGDDADIVAEVEVEKPSTFLVRESWHPRWRAYIDGSPAPVRRVTPDFPAVDVPVGKHTLELRFERPWWSLAAWLLWPGLTIAAFFYNRRRAAA